MAYKLSYKIPDSLERSFLDQEIVLSRNALVRSLPLRVVVFYLVSGLALFWVISSTFVKDADPWWIFALVVWWIIATVYFGAYSKTKELRIRSLPALLDYLPRSSRHVVTRSSSSASGFYSICGIKAVDDEGRIQFADGTVGRAYLVVGAASILVFEADKRSMVERVDAFYRKVEPEVEWLWITTKEPQRVYKQLATLERRNLDLEIRDPELFALLDEQASILSEHVGRRFNSIHQYLVIKAPDEERLRRAHALLAAEVSESSFMIKSCQVLDGKGVADLGKALFAA